MVVKSESSARVMLDFNVGCGPECMGQTSLPNALSRGNDGCGDPPFLKEETRRSIGICLAKRVTEASVEVWAYYCLMPYLVIFAAVSTFGVHYTPHSVPSLQGAISEWKVGCNGFHYTIIST